MNISELTFPCVAKHQSKPSGAGTTFIMYSENSGVVVEREPHSPYALGYIVDGTLSFRNIEDVKFITDKFLVSGYMDLLAPIYKAKKREVEIYESILHCK